MSNGLKETWIFIPGFDDYQVSGFGNIKSLKYSKSRILKPGTASGYRKVRLCKSGKVYQFAISHLVLLAFVGDCPKGMEVCHNNGISVDDRLDNLRYDTHEWNMRDMCSLANKQIVEIKRRALDGEKLSSIGRSYNMSIGHIKSICANEVEPRLYRKNKLDDGKVRQIYKMRNDGKTLSDIAKTFDISRSLVSLIARGLRWKHLYQSQET